ncbi:C4-dicarboxylate ABC transporter [Rhodobacterales bacterium HKCCE2091]|nr:C4-dicarboxylate ABC transporter [Rhodobacterales bacterium HKCCE2091]
MTMSVTRRGFAAVATAAAVACGLAGQAIAQDCVQLRLSSPASETDQRAVALTEVFAPAVEDFACFEPHWNASLFAQGTELEAIARGNLEMSIASAQELAEFFPEFSIFTAGYVHRDAAHQVAVFNDEVMDQFKQKVEDELGVHLLTVMYLGRRHVNLRFTREELDVQTPADLAGVNLRMPGSEAWQFLGRALGASPTPMAFTEVYTALASGAVDGQDNPLPTVVDARFYEVTNQIALTSHLVDLNYLAISAEVFNSLPEDQQQALQDAADAAAQAGRERQLALEDELVAFLEEQGLELYEPDLDAFRSTVQAAYLESDFSSSWPEGVLDRINELAE